MHYPKTIETLINTFSTLPGIGRKTAERFIFHLLKQPKEQLRSFSQAVNNLESEHFFCSNCFNFSETPGLCPICADPQRNRSTICVVEQIHDLHVIENTNEYSGLYHVLGGKIDPVEGLTADKLTTQRLIDRVRANGVQEIILALNPDIQGEGTILHLKNLLQPLNVRITILARGLPMGGDIEYADEITLANALKGRREL